jgi:hypothetical protein
MNISNGMMVMPFGASGHALWHNFLCLRLWALIELTPLRVWHDAYAFGHDGSAFGL